MKQAIQVWVSGHVQGVNYRYNTLLQAEKLGIVGWVRNLPDRRVEAWFEGTEAQIETMVQWCWQGSPASKVNDVVVQGRSPKNYQDFAILR